MGNGYFRNKAALRDIARTHEYLELERPEVWQKMLKKEKSLQRISHAASNRDGVGLLEADYLTDAESTEQIKWAKKHWHKLCRERGKTA